RAGLGVVRRVGGVELAAAGDRVNDGGDEVVVAAAAEEADRVVGRLVARCQLRQVPRQLDLAQRRRQVQRPVEAQLRRDVAEQVRDGGNPDLAEHRLHVFWGVGDVGQRQTTQLNLTPMGFAC